ncbi:NADH-quinone oxidoreductase subunit M [Nakamurella flavida]|uniref:NADH-quinone oxidoreductase subunit M n=1 Tax=Nakamurella flavida TaxID=363630 RepID=A0A939C4E3_9ACTN|nr:NADH-quinone oxidoreductase subunit M [Nakamurella flavida]MBM9475142.1 NADH-quinone oxidoreductase subunit M [Nakamurella flavida]MDP9776712.1 NADH-quinone oxidoreductase subunit M [Nakamurella flavida]
MLSAIVFLPLLVAAVLAVAPVSGSVARNAWVAVTLVEVGLVVVLWAVYRTPPTGQAAFAERVDWIPAAGTAYAVGVDGLSLPLLALTAIVFAACAVASRRSTPRPRTQAALFLFLQTSCLGVFAAQDLIVFFVFFDLSIVGMYFLISGWGHAGAARAALKFFLYTFVGSIALLAGFIGLFAGSSPHTFDMAALAADPPLQDRPVAGGLVLAAVLVGLAIKTPTIPFHTWLPPAHTEASATGSAVLAGILLKMGTYGFLRIAMPLLPAAWRSFAWVILAVGVISVLYGAMVALGQADFKRMVAYTSVNHMGYVVIAVGAAGLIGADQEQARQIAVTGAVVQMVSHGLITGALFLLTGPMWERTQTYRMADYGGLAGPAPRFTGLLAVGAFASLGLPAFSGFVAEFQIFAGSIALSPVVAVALPGIVITAALWLRALQRITLGETRGVSVGFPDLTVREMLPVTVLLGLSLVLGIAPGVLQDVVVPAADSIVRAVVR